MNRRVFNIFGSLLMLLICCSCDRRDYTPRENGTLAEIHSLEKAIDKFRADCGRYPTETEGLSVLVTNTGILGCRGSYTSETLKDMWGTPLRYQVIQDKPKITSAGIDGKFGSEDDLSN
jgi:general secretion pathway protein G